jgi:hypothetical protein
MYELPTASSTVGSESVASVTGRPNRLIEPIVQMSPIISEAIGSAAPQKLRNASRKTMKHKKAAIGEHAEYASRIHYRNAREQDFVIAGFGLGYTLDLFGDGARLRFRERLEEDVNGGGSRVC